MTFSQKEIERLARLSAERSLARRRSRTRYFSLLELAGNALSAALMIYLSICLLWLIG